MSLHEFLNMGGYAFYVWTAYALAAVVLIANVVVPLLTARRQRRALLGRLRARGARMTPKRKKRLMFVVLIVLGIGTAVAFGLSAFPTESAVFLHAVTSRGTARHPRAVRFAWAVWSRPAVSNANRMV